jgi:EAL domain-containing protein (putative c-di-GMP-specific phosphodiesterase class I)
VSELGGEADGHKIALVVVDLAHSLGMRSIAEGVEEPAQLSALRQAGCDDAQGYLIARPLPVDAVAELLRIWNEVPVAA